MLQEQVKALKKIAVVLLCLREILHHLHRKSQITAPQTLAHVLLTELYYIWRKHANLSSVKQLKPKTWRIFYEFDVILPNIHGNG